MKPKKFRCYNYGISDEKFRKINKLLCLIEHVTPIKHKVGVLIWPQKKLKEKRYKEKRAPDGFFASLHSKENHAFKKLKRRYRNWDCVIMIAGGGRLLTVIVTIIHEVAHYQQYRDKKKMTEDGIIKKVDALVARIFPTIKKESKDFIHRYQ